MMWPFKKKQRKSKRAYQSAALNRLTADWATLPTSADADIIPNLKTLRARSRNLVQNNDYARRFISMLRSNVVGHKGIILQNKAKDSKDVYDTVANEKIEVAWSDWGKKGTCTMCGGFSWTGLQQAVVESVARDGEVLIQKVRQGPYGFALHLLEADYLDEDFNDTKKRIRGGVQRDIWGKPIAYYVFEKHPGETAGNIHKRHHKRIPADQMIHVYVKERSSQTRGVPWLAVSAFRLKQIGAMEEAELVATRLAASKMGFFVSPNGDDYIGDDEEDNSPITDASPGTFEQLPAGMEFQAWNPDHPNTAFASFIKSALRGVASGVNVSYVGLANDLEGVSYSSIRQGELSDRDSWRLLQEWLIENFVSPVYEEWLLYALYSSKLNLPVRKLEKFNKPHWMGRGWNWVDPQKEISANIEAVKNGFKTLTDVVSEQGKDIEDVFDTLAREKQLMELYGLNLPTLTGGQNGKEEAGFAGEKPDDQE